MCTLALLPEIVGTWAGDVWWHTTVRVGDERWYAGTLPTLRKPERNQDDISLISVCMNLVYYYNCDMSKGTILRTRWMPLPLSFPSVLGKANYGIFKIVWFGIWNKKNVKSPRQGRSGDGNQKIYLVSPNEYMSTTVTIATIQHSTSQMVLDTQKRQNATETR